MKRWVFMCMVVLLFGACKKEQPPQEREPIPAGSRGQARLVAFGDVHGDLAATRRVLRLVGAIDEKDRWSGGTLRVVQVGDQLDRGDDERAILELFARLQKEAKATGGAFVVLNGNHEVMNVALDFRYVTAAGWADFRHLPLSKDPALSRYPVQKRHRIQAFRPGGVYAKLLATRPIVAILDDTVFVHGGLLPKHVEYGVDKINRESQAWMRGERAEIPSFLTAQDSPVWSRHFSIPQMTKDPDTCALLRQTLKKLKVSRMVVGHTPQNKGISSACDGKVWRIDTGMARHYGGGIQALEIKAGRVGVLK